MTDNEPLDASVGGSKRRQRIGKLQRPGQVAGELGRLYRSARRGEIDSLIASRLSSILGELRRALENAELEQRVEALEVALPSSNVVSLRARA